MNRVYRVIWNGVAGCWQAVAETARAKGKSDRQKTDSSSFTGNASLSPALRLAVIGLAATGAWAAPQGGQVTAGNAIILKNGVTTTPLNQKNCTGYDGTDRHTSTLVVWHFCCTGECSA